MRRPALALLTACCLGALAAAPAVHVTDDAEVGVVPEGCRLVDLAGTPDDTSDEVRVCESTQWIAAGATPLSNATAAVFSTDEPTAPLGGAGVGGSVTDIAVQGDPAHGLEVTGTFTGPLDSLDVEVFLTMPNAELERHGVTPQLVVDGFNFGGQLIDATVTTGDSGVQKLRFRVEGMLDLWPLLQFDTSPDAEHTLRLNLSPYYIGDDGAYLYGGTEVPSHVVLNAAG